MIYPLNRLQNELSGLVLALRKTTSDVNGPEFATLIFEDNARYLTLVDKPNFELFFKVPYAGREK